MFWSEVSQWDHSLLDLDTSDVNDSINLSNVTFINDLWVIVPASQIIIQTSIFLPIVLWGVFGNLSLLYIIIKNKNLQTPTNLLIANMALADFLTLLVYPWIFLASNFFQNYPLGAFGCRIDGGFECTLLIASVINLVAISYDRLNAIVLPQEHRITIMGAKIIMVCAWIGGFSIASPLFIFREYRERQWLNFLEKYCTENVMITNIYWHVIITMIVWVPLGTMLVCYITLFIKLDHYEHVVLKKIKTINVNYKKQVAKMMFVVIITFVVCRLPLTALIFYRNHLMKLNYINDFQQVQNQVNGVYYALWFTSRLLIFLNAAINPVIYGLTSEKFRKAFKLTTVSKWMFAINEQPSSEIKLKKQKQINTGSSTNKMKIFFIYKGRFNKNKTISKRINESGITDSTSNI